MEGGILEVLIVNAKDIRHTNLVGTPSYYVTIEYGTQVHKSKVSSGEDEKAWWNEKFTFEIPSFNWRNLTHMKFRIMDKELFTDSGFVGEVIVHLGGIISEGYERGSIEVKPAAYNVVLEDDTYKGEMKIGFKFTVKEVDVVEARELIAEEKKTKESTCSTIVNLWRTCWGRLLCFHEQNDSSSQKKQT